MVWIIMGVIVAVGTRFLSDKEAAGGVAFSMILGIIGAVALGFIVKVSSGLSFSPLGFSSLIAAFIGSVVLINLQGLIPRGESEENTEHEMSSQPTPL